jgi:gp16 family phage-associated protein
METMLQKQRVLYSQYHNQRIKPMSRTPQEAKDWLKHELRTPISWWARQNGYTYYAVNRVLNGESKCLYGEGREIAKKLGMKVPDVE